MENKKKQRVETLRGRPAKGKEKLTESINLKLSVADFKLVTEKAEKPGMKPTQYAREMTLKGQVKNRFTLEELDLMRKLSGMANNLNQLAKKAHIDGYSQASEVAFYLFFEIKKLLDDR